MDETRARTAAITLASFVFISCIASAGDNRWTKNTFPAYRVIAHPFTPGVLYAQAQDNAFRIYRSANHGQSWVSLEVKASLRAVAPGETVYAVYLDGLIEQLLKSTDSGVHWETISTREYHAPPYGFELFVDLANPSNLYRLDLLRPSPVCPFANSLARSRDAGNEWAPAGHWGQAGFVQVPTLALDPSTSGTLYATVFPVQYETCGSSNPPPAAVFKTSDSGDTWTTLPGAPLTASQFVVDPKSSATVYALVSGELMRSMDGGSTFTTLPSSAGHSFTSLKIDAVHEGRIYAASFGEGVLASSDSGGSWTPINAGLPRLDVQDLILDASGNELHAVLADGLYDYTVLGDPTALSLDPGRAFRVSVRASNPKTGENAAGLAIPVSDVFGYFSLPGLTGDPANPEVFVKILDGLSVNGAYWVFWSGMTGLEFELTVMEEDTGRTKTYLKPAGSACGGWDTATFTGS